MPQKLLGQILDNTVHIPVVKQWHFLLSLAMVSCAGFTPHTKICLGAFVLVSFEACKLTLSALLELVKRDS